MVLTGTDAQTERPYRATWGGVRKQGDVGCNAVGNDTSLWLLAVILIAIPACHIVLDVIRYIVSFSHVPNDTVIVP